MKRTRAQQPKAEEPQDPSAAAAAPANPSPKPQQRRAKQPRQPKAGARARPAAANAAPSSPGPETAPAVPDARAVDCWDLDAGLSAAAWWTWGVDEEKLLGWFPFVEEDFRCAGGGAAEVAAFDHDIWSIW